MAPIYTSRLPLKAWGIALVGLLFLSACSSNQGSGSERDSARQDSIKSAERSQIRSELYRNVKDAVWMVYTHNAGGGGAQGLAFMTDPSGVLVTNYQLLADEYGEVDPVGITVENSAGRQFVVSQILMRSAEGDYVTLRIRPPVGESFPTVRISTNEPQIGDECYIIGSTREAADSIFEGTISGYRNGRDYIKTTIKISAGSTGGPLLNGAGEVVGITTAATGKSGSDLALNIQHIPLPTANRVAVLPRRDDATSTRGAGEDRAPRQQTGSGEMGKGTPVRHVSNGAANNVPDTMIVVRKKAATSPRLEDLPATPVGEGEHGRVKNVVQQYFSAASLADYSGMQAVLAPVVDRFFREQNITREAAIASSKEYDSKNNTRVLTMEPHWDKAVIRALSEGYICTFPMDYSVSFRGVPKSFKLAMTLGLTEDFQINYITEKILSRQN